MFDKVEKILRLQKWGLTQFPAIVLALSIAGYPIAGLISFSLDIPSTDASIPFRILVFVLAMVTIAIYLPKSELLVSVTVILAFWFAYLCRLLYDAYVVNLIGAEFALSFFLVATLVPSLALMVAANHVHEDAVAVWAHVLGGLVCIWALIIESSGVSIDRNLTETVGRLSVDTVNPISLGHVAVTAVIAGYYLWGKIRSIRVRFLIAMNSIACMICLIETGSKAPAIALVLTIAFLIAVRVGIWRMLLGKLGVVVITTTLIVLLYTEMFSELPLYTRIENIGSDFSTIDRIDALTDAIQQAADNPWLGSAFMELNSAEYPHNSIVEAFMALGIPAGLVFIGITITGIRRAVTLSKTTRAFSALMFVQYLIGSMFSGSLYGNVVFWTSLVMLCNTRIVETRPYRASARMALQHR